MNKLFKIDPVVVVGVPTLQPAPISWEWAEYYFGLAFPLGTAVTRLRVHDKYVADARNQIVRQALALNAEWVLFISDDVLAPPRVYEMLWRHRKHMTTGVYWSKYQPTQPYLWNNSPEGKFLNGPFVDWTYGEFFKVDWAGCDCLLVNTEVFRKLEYPWFSHDWAYAPQSMPVNLATEDVYFYTKARAAGFELWCDSAVECDHIDRATGMKFGLTPEMPQFVGREKWKPKFDTGKEKPHIADIGCGFDTPFFQADASIVRIDGTSELKPDILCDVRTIPVAAETFDLVHVRHVLEHFSALEHEALLKEWVRILKVGGKLVINVPNLAHAAREVLKAEADPDYNAGYAYWQLYGRHQHLIMEEFHKSGFTKPGLRRFFELHPALSDREIAVSEEGDINLTGTALKQRSSAPLAILPLWDSIADKSNSNGNGYANDNGNDFKDSARELEAMSAS